MPRTKKKPEAAPSMPRLAAINVSTSDVLTLAEAAAYLRLSEAEVLRMIHEQALPARQVGTEWRLLKTAIQQWLSNGKTSGQANKEAWLALAGIWKDDPYVEDELKEILRQRGRSATEDES